MSIAEKYPDLKLRLISGAVLLALGGLTLYSGGALFLAVCVLLAGLMSWEVVALDQKTSMMNFVIAGLFAVTVLLSDLYGLNTALIGLLVTVAIYKVALKPNDSFLRAIILIAIFLSIIGLIKLRIDLSLIAILWVLSCVVASDIGGYFAGRTFGGPKLWPAVSPKKTWSGTIGGWILAACVGLYFSQYLAANIMICAVVSIIIAVFAQAGDLCESVLKRRAGVKDSSNLIPGHGGFLDRFDGVIGAGLLVALVFSCNHTGVFLG